MKLLYLDDDTIVNSDKIQNVTITNLQNLSKDRGFYSQTPDQRSRDDGLNWEVTVYIQSNTTTIFQKKFATKVYAENWIKSKFSGVLVSSL